MLFDKKLDALAADHNSLLAAAVRILEELQQLRAQGYRGGLNGHPTDIEANDHSDIRPSAYLDQISNEVARPSGEVNGLARTPDLPVPEVLGDGHNFTNLLPEGYATTLESFRRELSHSTASVQNLIGSLEDRLVAHLQAAREELSGSTGIEDLVASFEAKFSEQLESLRTELSSTRELVTEHLPLHVESSMFGTVNPEAALMNHLYSFLPDPTAIDVGAHRGEVSQELLDTGYVVYAFEPCPEIFEELRRRFRHRKNCHLSHFALGPRDATMELHLAQDTSATNAYGDASLFSSLVSHAMPPDLQFVNSVRVPVRSLQSLASEGVIPGNAGMLKIDTEGFDLEVLRGMGGLRPHVVATEFWSPDFVFGQSGAMNRLDELAHEMRERHYRWSIILYRISGNDRVSFYCNYDRPISNSWGNVFFFHDHELFLRAVEWCSAILPRTYLNIEDGPRGLHLAHTKTILPDLRARITTLEKLLANHDNNVRQLNEELAARNDELAARDQVLAVQDRELADRDQELAARVQELAARDRELAARHRELAAIEKMLTIREEESAKQLVVRDQQLAARDQQLADLDQQLTARNHELLAYGDKAARLAEQAKSMQERLRKTERRLDKMRRSLSWKLTSPFRELRRAGRVVGNLFVS